MTTTACDTNNNSLEEDSLYTPMKDTISLASSTVLPTINTNPFSVSPTKRKTFGETYKRPAY